MTQSPEHSDEQEPSPWTAPEPPHGQPPAHAGDFSAPPPPSQQPYAAAPPITEPYGGYGSTGASAQYAGRWRRLFAAILDGIILSAISAVVSAPFFGFVMYDSGSKHLGARLGADLVTAVIGLVYFAVQHGKWGQTIGKRALGIRVVRAEDGGAIGYGTAAWRVVFTYLISLVTCGIGGIIDVAWILGDQRRQALHDKVAKTIVVGADAPNPYEGR
jgi:uncharacterized RDD family membrane protein YckC